jgi:energy-coupling factor transporter ATP-binding protein EcfA2
MAEHDALLRVFLSGAKLDLFSSVQNRNQIFREDPFDVESVHQSARKQFQRLLAQATSPSGLDSGRILLLLGDSGSGKTHLVRAFRNLVHFNGLGFVAYMQMTTSITSYSRYLVSNLIDSLDQPYYESAGTGSGLLRLSNAIASRCGDTDTIRSLCNEANLGVDRVVELVERAADRLVAHPRYADLDLDLVRALLFLQRQDPALKHRVVKYLRCDALSDNDRKLLGGISSKVGEEDAQGLVERLGRLIAAFDNRSLVICVDQFEDTYHAEDAEARFRRVTSSLCAVADHVPSSIIVIACLKDYYTQQKIRLTRSTLDRLENDPAPVPLKAERSAEEIEKIIAQRLGYLYETAGVKPKDGTGDPLYPFSREFMHENAGKRPRDVLNACQTFREACIDAGCIVPWNGSAPFVVASVAPVHSLSDKTAKEKLEQEWNDFLVQYQEEPPEAENAIVELFGWAVKNCADGMDGKYRFEVVVKGETLEIRVMVRGATGEYRVGEEIFMVLCNRAAQGNGLRTQIEAAQRQAKGRILAILRTVEFPKNRGTMIWKVIEKIGEEGGRKAVLANNELRMIAAFQRFRGDHEKRPHFPAWLGEWRHLSKLMALIHVLALEDMQRFEQGLAPRATRPPAAPAPRP